MGNYFVFRHAFADNQFRLYILSVTHPFCENFIMRLDPFTRLCPHDISDTDPVVEFVGRDHREDLDLAAGNYDAQQDRVYENDGSGGLALAWSSPEVDSTRSLAWGDYVGARLGATRR